MRADEPSSASGHTSGGGRLDLWVGIASVVLGVILLATVIPVTIGRLGSDKTILAILGSSGLIAFGGLLAARAPRTPPETDAADEAAPEHAREAGSGSRIAAIVTLAIVLVYAVALEWLGFVLASYLCMAALMWVLGVRSVVRLAFLPALVSGTVYLGIDVALGSNLPAGEIPWHLLFDGSHGPGES